MTASLSTLRNLPAPFPGRPPPFAANPVPLPVTTCFAASFSCATAVKKIKITRWQGCLSLGSGRRSGRSVVKKKKSKHSFTGKPLCALLCSALLCFDLLCIFVPCPRACVLACLLAPRRDQDRIALASIHRVSLLTCPEKACLAPHSSPISIPRPPVIRGHAGH